MTTVNCVIKGVNYYEGYRWKYEDFVAPCKGYVGPAGGTNHYTAVLKIEIPKISGSEKGKIIEITANFVRANDLVETGKTKITITNRPPITGKYEVQGTEIGSFEYDLKIPLSNAQAHSKTFEIKLGDLSNNQQYVYAWLNTDGILYQLWANNNPWTATLTYTEQTPVETGSIITSGNQIFIPEDDVAVNWSAGKNGIENDISGYKVFCNIGSAPTISSSSSSFGPLASNVTSYIFKDILKEADRGKDIYVGVQALGDNGNGNLVTKKIGKINNKPRQPEIKKQTGTKVTLNSNITYEIDAGADTESTTSLYYSLNESSKNLFTSPLTISINTANIKNGENTIQFFTFDEKEYSSSISRTFVAEFYPTLTGITVTHTKVENTSGDKNIITDSEITLKTENGVASSVRLLFKKGDKSSSLKPYEELDSKYYTYNGKDTINFSIINLPSNIIDYGNYFKFGVQISSNNQDWSDIVEADSASTARRPLIPEQPTITLSENNYIQLNKYYDSKIKFEVTPKQNPNCAKISLIEIIANYGDLSKTYIYNGEELDLSEVSHLTETKFSVKITDIIGQNSLFYINTFTKASELTFAGSSIGINPAIFNPLRISDNDIFEIRHPYVKVVPAEDLSYSYKFQISDGVWFEVEEKEINEEQNEIAVTIKATTLQEAIEKEIGANPTESYDAKIIIEATDIFGRTVPLSGNFKVNYIEPPQFAAGASISFYHDFTIRNNKIEAIPENIEKVWPIGVNSEIDQINKAMFNEGEGLIFSIPKAESKNQKIEKYRFFLFKNNFEGLSDIEEPESIIFNENKPWQEISVEEMQDQGDFYYYYYTIKKRSKNESLYFKIYAVDETGEQSSNFIISDTCIIGCRIAQPIFNVNISKVEKNTTDDGNVLDFTCNLKVSDLGGSATAKGWDPLFYSSFPNLRFNKAILTIDVSGDALIFESAKEGIDITPEDGLLSLTTNEITITNVIKYNENWEKVYLRFSLSICYGVDEEGKEIFTNSLPKIYSTSNQAPTIAHRAHHIGVNTNTFDLNQVLVVENFGDRSMIILRGISEGDIGSKKEIIIDLLTGTITGLTIDCGTW